MQFVITVTVLMSCSINEVQHYN